MKHKLLFTSIILMLLSIGVYAQSEKEPYVVVDNNYIATFYYNNSKPDNALPIKSEFSDDLWNSIDYYIDKVVFDDSFKDFKPTSCAYWFSGFSEVKEIEGMEYLNTEDVTDMRSMFSYCEELKSVDVTHFNTANVTNMGGMFNYCRKLTTLDLSSFNTAKVTNMYSMFSSCVNLKTIFVGEEWTTNAVDPRPGYVYFIFEGCDHLFGAKGSSPTNMSYNGLSCAKIDGGSENPGFLTKKGDTPFQVKWPYALIKDSIATFYYGYEPDDALPMQSSYRNSWYPEYQELVKKVVFDESFKEYTPKSTDGWFEGLNNLTDIIGMKENLNTSEVTNMEQMFRYCYSLTTIDLSSFNTANVTNMESMFSNCSRLTTIDLSNFNTANVIKMRLMFYDCAKLTTIDLSNFNTENVTDMYAMFADCSCLTTLDLSSFNTANVTNMNSMFSDCRCLTTIDLSKFNTENVTNMNSMFSDCRSLKTIDLSKFNTANVTSMRELFSGCTNLRTIFVSDNWSTSSVTDYEGIFNNCDYLFGGKGTYCEESDIQYARIDGGTENPGYFTKLGEPAFVPIFAYAIVKDGIATFYYTNDKPANALQLRKEQDDKKWTSSIRSSIKKVVFDESFKNYKPTKISYWFNSMSNLTEIIGLENVNTSNLEYMNATFQFCKNLKTVDLSGFNTAKVTDMTRLFWGCDNLSSIFVDDGWTTAAVTQSSGMFEDCAYLYGGKGTAYNAENTDATYAKIDGGESNPGYLTKSGEPAFKKIVSIEITTAPKTNYVLGEEFSAANGIITITYHNGDKEPINLSEATITGYDKTKLGGQTLKVEYQGFETSLTTPVSSVVQTSDIKVWSSNRTIFIESTPDTKYTIIDLNGRMIKSATTKSTKEQINTLKSGVYIVVIGNDSYKVSLR